jgi:hypothetical protein
VAGLRWRLVNGDGLNGRLLLRGLHLHHLKQVGI